jgi:hypothetical protein
LRVAAYSPAPDANILRQPSFRRRLSDDLGLPPHCNISCYFGCMYALLFEPSPLLERELRAALAGFTVSAADAKDFDDDDDDKAGGDPSGADHAAADAVSSKKNEKLKTRVPLADAVIAVHQGRRRPLPLVGVQVRVGGPWAANFTVREPVRTAPGAFPFIFEDVRHMRCGAKRGQRCDASTAWPVFVTSDSERFVRLAAEELKIGGDFFSIEGNCFQHTDTQNVHQALPQKFAKADTGDAARRSAYACTLMNHVVLAASGAIVMGQSGYADTAFWAARNNDDTARRPAGVGFFMNMKDNRVAWEHTLTFRGFHPERSHRRDCCANPATSPKNRIVDVEANTDFVVENPFFEV